MGGLRHFYLSCPLLFHPLRTFLVEIVDVPKLRILTEFPYSRPIKTTIPLIETLRMIMLNAMVEKARFKIHKSVTLDVVFKNR